MRTLPAPGSPDRPADRPAARLGRRRTTAVSAAAVAVLAAAGAGILTLASPADTATATPTTAPIAIVETAPEPTTTTEPAPTTTAAPETSTTMAPTTSTTRRSTSTTKAATTTTTARAARSTVVDFRGDGVGPVGWGQGDESALEALLDAYGTPTWDSGWNDYGQGEERLVSWGRLTVRFAHPGSNRLVAGAYYSADGSADGPELRTAHGLGTVAGQSLRYDETFGDGRSTTDDAMHENAVCVPDGYGTVCAYFTNTLDEAGNIVHLPESEAWTVVSGKITPPHGC